MQLFFSTKHKGYQAWGEIQTSLLSSKPIKKYMQKALSHEDIVNLFPTHRIYQIWNE